MRTATQASGTPIVNESNAAPLADAVGARPLQVSAPRPPAAPPKRLSDADILARVPQDHSCLELSGSDEGEAAQSPAMSRTMLGGAKEVAIVSCEGLNGAYNYASLLLLVDGERVEPLVLRSSEGNRDPWEVAVEYDAVALEREGAVQLSVGHRERAFGDGGHYETHRWTGEAFVLVMVRSRDNGRLPLKHTGPWPVAAPPERRCAYAFGAMAADGTRVELRSLQSGGAERVHQVPIADAPCEIVGSAFLQCAGGTEYQVAADGGNWVVIRVSQDGLSTVAQVARGCDLPSED